MFQRSRSRQNSDWSREDVGDFFTPREEEYSWNDQKRRTDSEDDAVPRESEEDEDGTEEEDEEEENKEEQNGEGEEYPLMRRFTEGEVDRIKTIRQRLWRRKAGKIEVAWWSDPVLHTVRSVSSGEGLSPEVKSRLGVRSVEDAVPALMEDRGAGVQSTQNVALSAAEEDVFFKKVRRSMPKTKRCISDEALRKLDYERNDCACQCCVEWNQLRSEVRRSSHTKQSKQRWTGRVVKRAKRLVGREHDD